MVTIDQLGQWHAQWIKYLQQRKRSATTIRTCDTIVGAYLAWLRTQPQLAQMSALSVEHFEAYVTYLRDERIAIQDARHARNGNVSMPPPLAHSTIRTYIGVLTRWLQWLVERGRITAILDEDNIPLQPIALRNILERLLDQREPLVAPRMPNLQRLPGYYDQELQAFIAEQGIPRPHPGSVFRNYLNLLRNRALVAVLFASGGRIAEVLSINVEQVRQYGAIAYRVPIRGKGRKRRSLRLDDLAQEWISAYLDARATTYPEAAALFISHGPKANGKQLSSVSAWRIVKEAATWLAEQRRAEGAKADEVAKLQAISPHSLRHFLAQFLLDEGAEYKDIAALLGHSSTVVTEQVYARQDEDRTHEIADTFAPRAIVSNDPLPPGQQ